MKPLCLTFVCRIFTANNNYNYAKWVPIHLRDMLLLSKRCPDVFREFSAGKFVIQKTGNNFSGLAFDHGHEQVNAVIKGDGGAVGLTEDEDALRRWMLAMPEVIEILADYTSESDREMPSTGWVERSKKCLRIIYEWMPIGWIVCEKQKPRFWIHKSSNFKA